MNWSTIAKPSAQLRQWLIGLGLGIVLWLAAYSQLTAFADALVSAAGLSR
jgi:nicotinamide riboside transporter PnuC